MVQNYYLNQAFPALAKGQFASGTVVSQHSYQIDPASVATFGPASAVKFVDGTTPLPRVEKAAATDKIVGFIVYSTIKNVPVAGDIVNVAFTDSEIVMEAGAAIVRGAQLEIVATGDKVITSAGTNKIIGIALDKAAADGDLIRVRILAPLVAQV